RIDGALVDSPNKLSRLIGTLTPGARAKIDVIRDLKPLTLTILLTERRDAAAVSTTPPARAEVKLGIEVQELTPSLAEKFKLREAKGVVIMRIEPNSLAQAEGLHEGDLIKEVNRVETASLADYSAAISKTRRGDTILLRVLRETRAFYVVLKTSD
ncbi:MAG: PDZ domain-containing protein, partial [Nitrospira sp.]|nr:PDZ domain-containing protein [Nitrospira sp.]